MYKDHKLKSSYLIDITHNLILKYYFNKENRFNLSSLILREKYGSKYNYYMSYLVENGILEMVSNYFAGKKTKTYSILPSVLNGKISRYRNNDKTLLKKYKSGVLSIEDNGNSYNLIDGDIKQKLVSDLYHVDIDMDRSLCYLNSIMQDKDIYNRNIYSIECISKKHIFYHFDTYGRLHTNFTILKSFVRQHCLTIDGVDTKEIDIRNSQPLFLTKIMLNSNDTIKNSDEFELFKYLTINGILYRYIMDMSGIKEKKLVKSYIYKVFFGRNNLNSRPDKIFYSLFPNIHDFIRKYKKDNNDYKQLAYELQRQESNFIYNVIIREIMKRYPHIKFFTVHDSISYPKIYENEIMSIFNEKMDNLLA